MTDADRVQLGWRVDRETKRQFEEYAKRVYGDTPGFKGRALENAMRSAMGGDRIEEVESLLHDIADSLGIEKKKEKGTVPMADGRYHVPEGKNPGDVKARQRAVIDHLLDLAEDERLPSDDYGYFVTQKMLKNHIERIAEVSSDPTIKKYVEGIVSNGPLRNHPERPGVWVIEP